MRLQEHCKLATCSLAKINKQFLALRQEQLLTQAESSPKPLSCDNCTQTPICSWDSQMLPMVPKTTSQLQDVCSQQLGALSCGHLKSKVLLHNHPQKQSISHYLKQPERHASSGVQCTSWVCKPMWVCGYGYGLSMRYPLKTHTCATGLVRILRHYNSKHCYSITVYTTIFFFYFESQHWFQWLQPHLILQPLSQHELRLK